MIALGSVTRIPPVPGLREHALGLKDLGDAIRLRNHVLRRIELADAAPHSRRAAADLRRRRRRLLGRRGDRRGLRDGRRGAAQPPAPGSRPAPLGAGRRRRADPRPDARQPGALRRAHAGPARQSRSSPRRGWPPSTPRASGSPTGAGSRPRPWCGRPASPPTRSSGALGLPVDERGRVEVDETLRVVGQPSASGRSATAPRCPTWQPRASPTRRPASTRCARPGACRRTCAARRSPTASARWATWRRSGAATASRSWPACACAASPAGPSPAATTCCSCRSPRVARACSRTGRRPRSSAATWPSCRCRARVEQGA